MIGNPLRRLARSSRALFAILGNAALSVASLALSVAVARQSPISGFGAFAMAMVIYVFASGLLRASFADTALAKPTDGDALRRSFKRSSLTALIAAPALAVWGILASNYYLIIFAIAMHGMLALDFLRTYDSATGRAGRSLLLSSVWAGSTVASSVASLVWQVDPTVLFAIWAFGGAVVGYSAIALHHVSWLPSWPREQQETSAASIFALDYVVGSGGSALTTTLLGAVVSPTVIGAVRGAGTLLGPLNLIATTARSLSIPVLAQSQSQPKAEFRLAITVTAVLAAALIPFLVILQFLPTTWGERLLGETWTVAQLALLPLAVESLFALIGSIAAAGHRAAFAGRRVLILRFAVGVPRPMLVLASGIAWGITGATWTMAGIAVVNAVVWWSSYRAIIEARNRAVRA